jgi:peptidoglycan/xylan/chitin deacetylase (PgdA/CDA1 family)
MNIIQKLPAIKNIPNHLQAHHLCKNSITLENPKPVISFCFDDFPVSAYQEGAPVLEEYDVKATFYISLGLTGTISNTGEIASPRILEQLIEQGHEIGCHTYNHANAWKMSPRQYEESIRKNKKAFQELFPGVSMQTFAFPFGSATGKTKRIVEKYFSCGRGTYWGVNYHTIDLNILKSCHLSCHAGNAQEKYTIIKQVIDETQEKRGWSIFYIHDVQDNPTKFGCPPDFLKQVVKTAVQTGVKVLPVYDAYKNIHQAPSPGQ